MGSMRHIRLIACFGAAALAACLAWPVSAGYFNPDNIISDEEMRLCDAMDYEQIRDFLSDKGTLAQRADVDPVDGKKKDVARLIYDAAQRYRINPQYILVLMEKEMSLVTMDNPGADRLNWATGYSLCDGCSRRAPRSLKYKGLAKQIDAGAGWMDWYMTNAKSLKNMRVPGNPYDISKITVTPQNLATAGLYNYTPHLHGNRLFWSIWNRWFGDDDFGMNLPDGTLIRNEKNGAVALMQGGKFRPIANASVLATRFRGRNIVDLNQYDFSLLEKTKPGRPVKFTDLSLVRTVEGSVYLLTGDKSRKIASQEVFAKIGFNPEEVETISAADLADYDEGEPIIDNEANPSGELLLDDATGGVFWAEAGIKYPVIDQTVLKTAFAGVRPRATSAEELSPLEEGAPVKLPDGTLVKASDDPKVFVISGGKKLPIDSEDAFLSFGYSFKKVLTAPKSVLDLHETGTAITLGKK